MIDYSDEKDAIIRKTRGVWFEDVIDALEDGRLLRVEKNQIRSHQNNLVVLIQDYVYICPYVETDDGIFLKTIYPSRKATKIYLQSLSHD